MLNVQLVDAFRSVNAAKRTVALEVTRGERQWKFFFDQGELCLLDFCMEKEALLARQYLNYNKIGPELEAVVVSAFTQDGTRVQDYLLSQQLVTPEEVEQVTRTLVEDALCEVFGNPSDRIQLDEQARFESFDLAHTAVKLRIQVEMLLRMVQSRVAERDSVTREIAAWSQSFSLVEDAPDSGNLNDAERNVLHFVDGRKTVAEIAGALRDSPMNVACYLISLKLQGFITTSGMTAKRLDPITTATVTPAAAGRPTAVMPDLATLNAPPPPPEIRQSTAQVLPDDFRMVRAQPVASGSWARRFVLLAVLLVVAGIGALVMLSEQSQQQIDTLQEQIDRDVEAGRWDDADKKIVTARQEAGNDTASLSRLDTLKVRLHQRFDQRLEEASTAIAGRHLAEAERILAGFPDHPLANLWTPELHPRLVAVRQDLEKAQAEIERQGVALAEQVQRLLQARQIDPALELVAKADGAVKKDAEGALATWRDNVSEQVRTELLPISERRALIALVLNTKPTAEMTARLARITAELDAVDQALDQDIARLRQLLAAGDHVTVVRDLEKWSKRLRGHPREQDLAALKAASEELQTRLSGFAPRLAVAIEKSDAAALGSLAKEMDEIIAKMPGATGVADLTAMRRLVDAVVAASAVASAEGELAAFQSIDTANVPEAPRKAVAARIARMQELVSSASEDLQRGQDLLRSHRLEQAKAVLSTLIKDPRLARTESSRIAARDLEAITVVMSRQEARMANLRQAMINDQQEEVLRLAREMDLPRLPLAIRSVPVGVEVALADKVLGTTPLIIDDMSDASLEAIYVLRCPGYREAKVQRGLAVAGWRVQIQLERQPAVDVDLGTTITTVPSAVAGTILVAGNRALYAVAADGTVKATPFEGTAAALARPLTEPAYAPVVEIGGSLLVTTRDNCVVEILTGKAFRRSVSGKSDLAVAIYTSPNILDRKVLILAGLDGRLHANDPYRSTESWEGRTGTAFAASPLVIGDSVLAVRRDGIMESYIADNGAMTHEISLGAKVLSAQPLAKGFAGLGDTQTWRWEGGKEIVQESLPVAAVLGTSDLFQSVSRRVFARQDGEWKELCRIPADRTVRQLLRWGDALVISYGDEIQVLGPRPFQLRDPHEFLAPALDGQRLITVTTSGKVRVFAP